MRKSVAEKLKIIKQATSRKRIKNLAALHGVTTRTIKNWMIAHKNGLLAEKICCGNTNCEHSHVKIRVKPLSELVLKVFELYPIHKEKPVFRYLIKDINHGFVFCAYSPVKEKRILSQFIAQFISESKRSGLKIKRIFIDQSCDICEVDRTRYKDIDFIIKNYKEIRKHLTFSLKKFTYIKERTRYDNVSDFLFDSLATASRINEMIMDRSGMKSKKFRAFVKKTNMILHSDLVYDCGNFFDRDKLITDLKGKYAVAQELKRMNNHETSDHLCEKLIHILNWSEFDNELLINAMIKRSKISIIRSNTDVTKDILKSALNKIRALPSDKQDLFKYQIYMLYSDCHRMIKDVKNSIYHLNKAQNIVSALNDEKALALFYLNSGLIVKELFNADKAIECYKKSIDLSEKNGYHEIKAQAYNMIDQINKSSIAYPESRHQFI
jgi:hypothetical protein